MTGELPVSKPAKKDGFLPITKVLQFENGTEKNIKCCPKSY